MKTGARTVGLVLLAFVAGCGVSPSSPQAPVETGIEEDWLSVVSRRIEASSYRFRDGGGGVEATCAGQGLALEIEEGDLRVRPALDPEVPLRSSLGGWTLSLRTVAWGRGEAPSPIEPSGPVLGACRSDGAVDAEGKCIRRAEMAHPDLVEWVENRPEGVEQGWDLTAPPAGSGPVRIEVEVEGMDVEVASDQRSATFVGRRGGRLSYSGLAAWDARNRPLPAWLETRSGGLTVVVDDRHAAWPIRVDPVLHTEQWFQAGPHNGAHFGNSMASAGDANGDGHEDVIVGAYLTSAGGSAFLYLGSATGLETVAAWTGESDQAAAEYGVSVAGVGDVDGDGLDDVVVGARDHDTTGRVFLYKGSATGLEVTEAWSVVGPTGVGEFGAAVAGVGDVNGDGNPDLLVGDQMYDGGESDEGAAFIFLGDGATFPSTPSWQVESNQDGWKFGLSVASAGDVNGDGLQDIVVGAPFASSSDGRAWLYLGGLTVPSTTAAWIGQGEQADAFFGIQANGVGDVNGDGYDDVAIGASGWDGAALAEGKAYLYFGSASGLGATADWTVEPGHASAEFGFGLAGADLNGDGFSDLAVGAHHYSGGQADEGAAFVFLGSSSGPGPAANWVGESNSVNAKAGSALCAADTNGDGFADLLVGGNYYGGGDEGGAWLWYGTSAGLVSTMPGWSAVGGQADAKLGWAVSSAGDVNGDGFGDIVAGAPYFGVGGAAFVYLGSASGPATAASWSQETSVGGARFGFAVAHAGDVDGDGYGDVVVGADYGGAAWLYTGSPSGLDSNHAWTQAPGGYFGRSVSSAGDVNGDGFADVIVGAEALPNSLGFDGAAFAYHGSASGLDTTPAWTSEADQAANPHWARAVSSAGDVNGDGYSDVVVGAWGYDDGESSEGAVLVYEGSASGLDGTPATLLQSNQDGASLGSWVSGAGDVDGDGYADVIAGAHGWDGGQNGEGAALLYLGSATGVSTSASWTFESNQTMGGLGEAVASAGDINGDGYSDLVIGAHDYTTTQPADGIVYAFFGSSSGPSTAPGWTATGDQAYSGMGYDVASAGDVDGDGFADILVGVSGWDGDFVGEGAVFLYYGAGASLTESPPPWTAESDLPGAMLGHSVAPAGDVDGDGYDDVVVGAPLYSNPESNEGAALLFLGTSAGLSAAPVWQVETDQPDAALGSSVSSAGDVNGDGYSDLAMLGVSGVSAPGQVFVYLGSTLGPGATPDWIAQALTSGTRFGHSVAAAGDVDADGFGDLLIGAPHYDGGQPLEGAAYLYAGSATGLGATSSWMVEGDQDGAGLGYSVSSAGDCDGDGFDDVLVGAPTYDDGETDEGAAFLYLGSPFGLETVASWMGQADQAGGEFGQSVSGAQDVDGDGYADAVIGAYLHPFTTSNEGAAFVYAGSATGLSLDPVWAAGSGQINSRFGHSVGGGGDVDGDGLGDLTIGALFYSDGGLDEGGAFLFAGSPSGLAAQPNWLTVGGQDESRWGASLASAGDVNGDGFGDLVLGAYRYDNPEVDEGAAFLYLGGSADGTTPIGGAAPLILQTASGAPIPPGGRSDSIDGFDIGLLARAPFGRVGGKLQWEVEPLGTSFDGAGLSESAAFTDLGTSGTWLQETVEGLAPETGYHWRARVLYDPADAPPQPWSPWYWGGRSGDPHGRHVVTACASDVDLDGRCDSYDPDADGDGVDAPADCDDADPAVFPAAAESCDAVDSDCDGSLVDEFDDTDGDLDPDCTDPDDDGDADPDATDCAPLDPMISTGATESCDAIDSDCDGSLVDEFDDTDTDLDPDCTDPDDDGDGDPDLSDCAPLDPSVFTGAVESCDAIDSDCDGSLVDEFTDTDGDLDPDCTDLDDDADGDPDITDCAPLDSSILTGATEACDAVDSDCDGSLVDEFDDTDGDNEPDCVDLDDDGDGDPDASDCAPLDDTIHAAATESCDTVDSDCDGSLVDEFTDTDSDGDPDCTDTDDDGDLEPDDTDCAPLDGSVFPGAAEFCDLVDSDCDGSLVDEFDDTDGDGLPDCVEEDADADGDPADTDCDDQDASIYTGAPETPDDGIDQDCNDTDTVTCWPNLDEDQFGAGTPVLEPDGDCAEPDLAEVDGDCDDEDPETYPGAVELCDGVDNDCDEDVDEDYQFLDWYLDADGDGSGDPDTPYADNPWCDQPDGHVADDSDCDDEEETIHPGAEEVVNGVDDDCDGVLLPDETDGDGDGLAPFEGDCDDSDPAVFEGAEEVCGDGIDQDCDGAENGGRDDPECWPVGCGDCAVGDRPALPLALVPLLVLVLRRQRGGGVSSPPPDEETS